VPRAPDVAPAANDPSIGRAGAATAPAGAQRVPSGARAALVRLAVAVERGIELSCNGLMLVSGIGLLALLNVVVLLRYGFESGLEFAPDLSELLFAILVMAGIAQAARRGVHVATQLLINALHARARLAAHVFIHAVTAVTYFLLAWYAMENAIIANDQTTPVLHIPWSVGYGCLATGLALVGLCSVTAIVRHTLGDERVVVDLADPGAAAV
jgi:TRAP-type C4-dicarboxylate transport system permease small subunit